MRRLHHLSFVTATLIVSLVCPMQIEVKLLGIEAVRAQTTEESKTEVTRLFELGTQYYEKGQFQEALEIAERSRARAFVELLTSKLSSNSDNKQTPPSTLPNLKQIQQIANEQKATLVEYSVVYPPDYQLEVKEKQRPSRLYIWVVKPTGQVAFKQVDIKSLNTTNDYETERIF